MHMKKHYWANRKSTALGTHRFFTTAKSYLYEIQAVNKTK
jgi:hypothetical protein